MGRGWKLSGVLVGLAVLAMACREPTPTPMPTPTINEARAIEIAREAGLEPGIEPWKPILWRKGRYSSRSYWLIKTTLRQSDYKQFGRRVFIDADTGDAYKVDDWEEVLLGGVPEDEGILLIKSTPEYKSLVDIFGSDHVSVKAVNLHNKGEADFLRNISDRFLMEPGCIIVLKAGKGEGYVYQLDEEFRIVSRMTLSDFEEGARNVDAGTMEHFYSSLK